MRENKVICPFYMNDSQSKIYCQGCMIAQSIEYEYNTENKTKI